MFQDNSRWGALVLAEAAAHHNALLQDSPTTLNGGYRALESGYPGHNGAASHSSKEADISRAAATTHARCHPNAGAGVCRPSCRV